MQGIQCSHPRVSMWHEFKESLRAGPHDQPLSTSALHQTIVRVYARRLFNDPVYQATAATEECLFDAILDHYNHGCELPALSLDPEHLASDGPIVRLLLSAQQLQQSHLKFKTFCLLAGKPADTWLTDICSHVLMRSSWS